MEAQTLSAPESSRADLSRLRLRLKELRAENSAQWTAKVNPDRALQYLAKSVDEVLRDLWSCSGFGDATLVAVGGYGRGELSPFSDVDLLILMPDGYRESDIAAPAERLVSALWDIGLDAGHSIRSIDECMVAATEELSIATALLESRWVAGPKPPVKRLMERWFATMDVKEFAQGKLLELQQRHGRHQDTPYSLEPNCKESPGGLRDLQVLRWVTTAFGLGHRWRDLATNELITTHEARELARCQRLLNTKPPRQLQMMTRSSKSLATLAAPSSFWMRPSFRNTSTTTPRSWQKL
jgi:[protein-PII] uridylyltransferase